MLMASGTWSADEFDGDSLDLTKWSYEDDCWGGGNNERQCYTKENVAVEGGFLKIIARKERTRGFANTRSARNGEVCLSARHKTISKSETPLFIGPNYNQGQRRLEIWSGGSANETPYRARALAGILDVALLIMPMAVGPRRGKLI